MELALLLLKSWLKQALIGLWYNTDRAAAEKGAKLALKFGASVETDQGEVLDPLKVQSTITKMVEDFGRLDVFIANAGMAISKPILEICIELFRKNLSDGKGWKDEEGKSALHKTQLRIAA